MAFDLAKVGLAFALHPQFLFVPINVENHHLLGLTVRLLE
jgi:hypothetical protein